MAYLDLEDPRLKESKRKHYRNNKAQYRQRVVEYRERNRSIVREHKNRPCADCGIQYGFWNMHFDHLGDEEKDRCINRMAHSPASVARLLAEIAKCEVVCALCHGDRTYFRAHMGEAEVAGESPKLSPIRFDS